MRKWQLVGALSVGIMASGTGFIQADAAIFNYSVDFLDKEVDDFNNFTPAFNPDTYNLDAKITFSWFGTYYFDTCPAGPVEELPIIYRIWYSVNGIGGYTQILSESFPPLTCSTAPQTYDVTKTASLPGNVIDAIINDDANYVFFRSGFTFGTNTNLLGSTIFLENYVNYFNVFYEFNTTYLFNYFLSDQQFVSRGVSNAARWTFNSTQNVFLEYVYTTAGNDTYVIENSLQTSIGTTRKKYAINYEDVYFRGESVGAQFRNEYGINVDSFNYLGPENLLYIYIYSFLNTSNLEQALVDVPEFNFEYEDCGSFLALNVGCFINNGLAYITNDAPIISDAITLLNAGMKLAGQAFGVIGSFTDNNVFGVLVLGGLGLIAVRWFLKND